MPQSDHTHLTADETAPHAAGTMLAMSVAKMGFLIDRLNRDCAPLQFIRELTKNAMQGIERLPDQIGEIHWDVDWRLHEQWGPSSAKKLCIIDTGIGMSGQEMVEFINKLSSSVHEQSATGNFGVGSKIAAAPLNPEGMIYLSWKQGNGAMIHLYKDGATGEYGLKRFDNGLYWQPVGDEVKPDPIGLSGTMVVLLGTSLNHVTAAAPPGTWNPPRWIQQYLNIRFLEIAPGTTVRTRSGWDRPRNDPHNRLEEVTGMRPWLMANAQSSGRVDLPVSGAAVHWWILRSDADFDDWRYIPEGHIAALFQGELYEFLFRGSAFVRMQTFGILFGPQRVVLYVEPIQARDRLVTANTARTNLLVNHQSLDWGAYAVEFRRLMPSELVAYQESFGADQEQAVRQDQIRDRLKTMSSLFKVGGYRRRKPKAVEPTVAADLDSPSVPESDQQHADGSVDSPATSASDPGDIVSLFSDDPDEEMDQIGTPPQPDVRWVTIADGSRNAHDLNRRAARYLPDRHALIINGDFRGFTDIIDRWTDRFAHIPGARTIAQSIAREWFEQQLVETIMSALALKEDVSWAPDDLTGLWSEHALTSAVLPRYHIDQIMEKLMAARLRSLLRAA